MGKSDHLKVFGKKSGGKEARSPETRSRNSRSSTDNRSSTGNNGSDNPMAMLSDLDLGEGADDDPDFD